MSYESAHAALEALGLSGRIRRFPASTATAQLAAEALGVPEGAIAKSMALMGPNGPILIIAAGDSKISSSAFKKRFGIKAKFIGGGEVEALVGHAPGGVCPFGRREGVEVWLDESLRAHAKVWPACGDAASGVELTPDELFEAAGAAGWCSVTVPRNTAP